VVRGLRDEGLKTLVLPWDQMGIYLVLGAVVGVIANLAIYFAIHTLFREVSSFTWGPVDLQVPHLDSLKPLSLAVAAFAALLLFRAKWSVLRTLGACAFVGLGAGIIDLLAT